MVLPTDVFEELAVAYLQKLDVTVLAFEIRFFPQVAEAYRWVKNKPFTSTNLHIE